MHCIVHVPDLARMWHCVLGAPAGDDGAVVAQLAGWSLDLSCTAMGVCIYRVARKQTGLCPSPRRLEDAVKRVCTAAHAVLVHLPE